MKKPRTNTASAAEITSAAGDSAADATRHGVIQNKDMHPNSAMNDDTVAGASKVRSGNVLSFINHVRPYLK